jgi:hypothetical protein
MTYPIPSPEWVAENGPYDPVERMETLGKQKVVYVAECAKEVGGQLPNLIRQRHGIPPIEDGVRRWNALRNRERAWNDKLAREAKRAEKAE